MSYWTGSHDYGTWKCLNCGNTEEFGAPAELHGYAKVDGKGRFNWWINDGAEDPDIGDPCECLECHSTNIALVEEEEDDASDEED